MSFANFIKENVVDGLSFCPYELEISLCNGSMNKLYNIIYPTKVRTIN